MDQSLLFRGKEDIFVVNYLDTEWLLFRNTDSLALWPRCSGFGPWESAILFKSNNSSLSWGFIYLTLDLVSLPSPRQKIGSPQWKTAKLGPWWDRFDWFGKASHPTIVRDPCLSESWSCICKMKLIPPSLGPIPPRGRHSFFLPLFIEWVLPSSQLSATGIDLPNMQSWSYLLLRDLGIKSKKFKLPDLTFKQGDCMLVCVW